MISEQDFVKHGASGRHRPVWAKDTRLYRSDHGRVDLAK
jgi:hypothetical protein